MTHPLPRPAAGAAPTPGTRPGDLAELTARAEQAVAGRGRLVGPLRRFAYAKSSPMYVATVRDGTRELPVVVKDLSRRSLLAGAAAVKPAFLHDPRREAAMYRDVLGQVDGPPAHVGSHLDGTDPSVLVVELVDGLELSDVGEIDVWARAAAWFGAFHASDALDRASAVPLVAHDDRARVRWRDRAAAAAERLDGAARRRVARAVEVFDGPGRERLASATTGLVHGEAYPSNLVVGVTPAAGTAAGAAPRICPVDWETAGRGPVLIDLAALVTGDWAPGDRQRLLAAYRAAARAGGLGFDDFAVELAACRLQLALQWVGWFVDHAPPDRHARDWAAEAADAADAMG
ncbi:MAG TPA: hypothetical protein VFW63_00165 [Acidimicrobiales bacterium]|nr:hypothetical protein [Acidimicrobiales bacterium]